MSRTDPPPKVSVLLPTYNYARFLPEAIESVLAQDFTDFELLISDDASRDDSAAVIRRFAARDPRIRVRIYSENIGMVANWNACLRQARGDYIKFIFGDDCFMRPDALGRMVAQLDATPEAVLVASARTILDAHSRVVTIWNDWRAPGFHRGAEVIRRCLREDRNLIGEPSAVLFRRAAAQRGFDPQFRQVVDLDMWLHLLRGGDFVYLAEPLCAFRQHEEQQTAVNRRANVGPLECLALLARYLDELRLTPGGERTFAASHLLFERLYYSRKHAPRTPTLVAAEASVRERLGRFGYGVHWSWHRFTKPWLNLRRFVRRRLASPTRAPWPAAVSPWAPTMRPAALRASGRRSA
ncbi:MAG TPA: glycosyltransferase [Opitutaceae bacterium]|nr:glycosyltransferase [Opitutaceae bacterium]